MQRCNIVAEIHNERHCYCYENAFHNVNPIETISQPPTSMANCEATHKAHSSTSMRATIHALTRYSSKSARISKLIGAKLQKKQCFTRACRCRFECYTQPSLQLHLRLPMSQALQDPRHRPCRIMLQQTIDPRACKATQHHLWCQCHS